MKKNNIPEIICFILFCIGTIIISCFHEAWFDEFQAWGISKDSIYNILFVIPHLEGHPPLWHLILKCFSFFNVNCELGIKIPNLLFMFGAVWLLIFKSPFLRIVRLTLPFTYFIFYQYSVVSRPYSIFCFAIFLAALFYKERNEHPYKFVLALAILCLSSAYGMVISSGIIIVWFIEILKRKGVSEVIKTFIKDKRFYAMFIIFLLCAALAAIMYPDKDVFFYDGLIHQLSFIKRFLLTIFILPADCLFLNLLKEYSVNNDVYTNTNIFLFGCLCGLFVNFVFFFMFKSAKKLLLFYIPYVLILILFFNVYFNNHHMGMLTIFYIYVLWCLLSICNNFKFKKFLLFFFLFVIIVQIYWSISACINEIKYPYSVSRDIAKFIKDNNFQDYKIMERWYENNRYYVNKHTGEIINENAVIKNIDYDKFINDYEEKKRINFHQQHIATVINPYFGKNIVYTYNVNYPDKQYTIFKNMQESEVNEIKQKLKQKGFPDIILDEAQLYDIFNWEELKSVNYIPIKEFYFYKIWKDNYTKYSNEMFIRSDLFYK